MNKLFFLLFAMTLVSKIQSSTNTTIPNYLKCVDGWENIDNFFGTEMNQKLVRTFPLEAQILKHDAFLMHEPWPEEQNDCSNIVLFKTIKTRMRRYFGKFPSLVGCDDLIIKRDSGQLTISRIGIIKAFKEYCQPNYFMIRRTLTNDSKIQNFDIIQVTSKSPYIISKHYQKTFCMVLWIRVDESEKFYKFVLPTNCEKQNMIFVKEISFFSNIEAKYENLFLLSPRQIFNKKISRSIFESGSKFLSSEILFSVRDQIVIANKTMKQLSETDFDELAAEIQYYLQNSKNIPDHEIEEDLIKAEFIPSEFNSRLYFHEYHKTFDNKIIFYSYN